MLKVGTEQATRDRSHGGALLLHALTDLIAFLYHKKKKKFPQTKIVY